MRLAELQEAGRTPPLPLDIELPEGPLRLLSLLRVLPGQRYVGAAEWRGRRVLAKLLVGGRAQRQHARELAGARLLGEQGLATPELLAEGLAVGEGGWLLFEFLDDAVSLGSVWQAMADQPPLSAAQHALLAEALAAVGRLHARGLWQDDLHLDNLLRRDGRLYLIDGGGIRAQSPGQPLARVQALQNLAVFFAQLPAELEPFIEELLVHYRAGNPGAELRAADLRDSIAEVRRWRLKDYLKKLGRDCTLFCVERERGGLSIARRDQADQLLALLRDADAAIAAGRALKQGGSATVARVELAGRSLVIKRYNIKGFMHWLKRCWRPSRAWHSWVEGNRLEFLGIATPRPLAMRESRRFGLRGRAWLITEHADGEDILNRFAAHVHGAPPEAELQALERLFAALLRERIGHGDLKGTNLLWQDGRWALIDLDAMRQHRCPRRFARAYARDRARFLRNWPADSALYRLLDERLPQVPDTCPE
ncbi:serine/threonine protein kinase [Pseudomonas stutzeri]|nr:serine/threonine protein kinase [Stutzerimonas stutzeri]